MDQATWGSAAPIRARAACLAARAASAVGVDERQSPAPLTLDHGQTCLFTSILEVQTDLSIVFVVSKEPR